jgi:hypothetical protein
VIQDVKLDPARKAAMRALLEDVAATEGSRRSRLRLPVAVGVGAAVTLAGGTAAAYVITQRPVTEQGMVHCLARAELAASGTYPGSAVMVSAPDGDEVAVDDALGACEQLWRDGVLDPDAATGTPAAGPRPGRNAGVPSQLSVCVMPDGTAAVLPGPATACPELGLDLRQE